MTEPSPTDGSPAAQPSTDWPLTGNQAVADRLVQQSLARLDALPQAPVGEHEALYSELHDELRAALDADPTDADGPGNPGRNPAGANPTDGGA